LARLCIAGKVITRFADLAIIRRATQGRAERERDQVGPGIFRNEIIKPRRVACGNGFHDFVVHHEESLRRGDSLSASRANSPAIIDVKVGEKIGHQFRARTKTALHISGAPV
jgi:hypothetical protein